MAVRVFGAGEAQGGLQKKPRASEYAETFMINQTTQLPTQGTGQGVGGLSRRGRPIFWQ